MPAKSITRSEGPESYAEMRQQMASGEIRALLETPELRRIFDGDGQMSAPQRGRSAERRRRDPARCAEPPERPRAEARPRSRNRGTRIVVGLVPVWLAGLIIIFEIAREPAPFLQLVGNPGASGEAAVTRHADETALRAMASTGDASDESAATAESGLAALAGTATAEKSATDLAKPLMSPAGQAFPAAAQADEAAASDTLRTADNSVSPDLARDVPAAAPKPAPRDGAIIDPAVAATSEESLGLSPQDRSEVQLRLRLADFDPQLVDGIFGSATRAAITAWQQATGIPATGFLDRSAMSLLVEQTAEEYRAWQVAERARRQHEKAHDAVVASSVPPVRPAPITDPEVNTAQDSCRRTTKGEIAFGQSVSCDARGVRENFKQDLRGLRHKIEQLFR